MDAKNYVFISYSTKNRALADTMRALLSENGLNTWMAPEDIPAGSKYAQVINRAVKNCACFVLILSDDAQNSIWVAKEVERAVNYRRPILPVQIEDVVLNDEFELYISTDQVTTTREISGESKEIKKLLSSLHTYVQTFKGENDFDSTNYYLESHNDGLTRYRLDNANLIGRDLRKSTIRIESNLVSRVHAWINCIDQTWFARDLHTTMGTFLNGIRLDPDTDAEVKDGDTIRFGDKEFVFRGIPETSVIHQEALSNNAQSRQSPPRVKNCKD